MTITSDEPPNETNGNGRPVTGSSPITAPILMNAWLTIQQVMPMARKRPKRSGARAAVRIPRKASAPKRPTTRRLPIRPSSSPMMAKMKSVWALGRKPHFARLAPRPTPQRWPEPKPTSDWTT